VSPREWNSCWATGRGKTAIVAVPGALFPRMKCLS